MEANEKKNVQKFGGIEISPPWCQETKFGTRAGDATHSCSGHIIAKLQCQFCIYWWRRLNNRVLLLCLLHAKMSWLLDPVRKNKPERYCFCFQYSEKAKNWEWGSKSLLGYVKHNPMNFKSILLFFVVYLIPCNTYMRVICPAWISTC